MKIHILTRAQLQFAQIVPCDGYELCMYEAEASDKWRGFVVGRSGWAGQGLPGATKSTYTGAMLAWTLRFNRRPYAGLMEYVL
jgi:hypothetical protein